jgi:folliculin
VFEDPIYFDDDKDGSVIGYEFSIKDSEGRGLQRSYSLIIIMKDRIYLQHLWSFLSEQMSIIATNIKREAEAKFNKDIALLDDKISDNLNQIGINPAPSASTLLAASAALTSSQRQTLYTKKLNANSSVKQVRGLIELTDDPLIFAKLHMWFTWVLRMSQCQIVEEFMMGPLTEDFQVKFERERLNESYASSRKRYKNNSKKYFNIPSKKHYIFSIRTYVALAFKNIRTERI